MKLAHWFKSKIKRYFRVNEKKSSNHYNSCSNLKFDNIIIDRRNNKSQWYKCFNCITSSNTKFNLKVQENSNRFFRNHAPNITKIIKEVFGNNSIYSSVSIREEIIDYKFDIPRLSPPPITDIAFAIKHLDSGYRELNSLREQVEQKINMKIDNIEKHRIKIESKIKDFIQLNKFTFKQDTYLPDIPIIQNIYNPNLFYGIIESIHNKNKYLDIGYDIKRRNDENGIPLPQLTYKLLYFVSQSNENDKSLIALGSEENIDDLKTSIKNLIFSDDVELKELIMTYYDEIKDIKNDNDLKGFINSVEEVCSKIQTGQERLKGKCNECPSWLDYFG